MAFRYQCGNFSTNGTIGFGTIGASDAADTSDSYGTTGANDTTGNNGITARALKTCGQMHPHGA